MEGLSGVEFPSAKIELLFRILNFFRHDITTGMKEIDDGESPLNMKCFLNPLKKLTVLTFQLEKPSEVSVSIADINGKVVDYPVSGGKLKAGNHKILRNTTSLKKGIYFCTLRSNDINETIKLVKFK